MSGLEDKAVRNRMVRDLHAWWLDERPRDYRRKMSADKAFTEGASMALGIVGRRAERLVRRRRHAVDVQRAYLLGLKRGYRAAEDESSSGCGRC